MFTPCGPTRARSRFSRGTATPFLAACLRLNRLTEPAHITFVRGEGAPCGTPTATGIDYHGAFAPQFLGYGHPRVVEAVKRALDEGLDLFGSSASRQEGRLAELMLEHLGWADSAAFFNSGSEATARPFMAQTATGRDRIIVMQGGYNGWHNDVACNLMTPLEARSGPEFTPANTPSCPTSAVGIPQAHRALVHPVNFNSISARCAGSASAIPWRRSSPSPSCKTSG
ncbi:MAG: aminotransferase class III-fold pyridoxal phosphate-dependent enzyme [Bryobacterales bacterium]